MKKLLLAFLALILVNFYYSQNLNWAESSYASYGVGGNFVFGIKNNQIDKLDFNGNLIETFVLNSVVTEIEVIAANNSDEFAVAGHFVTTEDFDLTGSNPHVVNINNRDYFYAKYSSNGSLQFINTIDDGTTTTNNNIHATDIRLEDNGAFYLLGNCSGFVDFNEDGVTTSNSFVTDGQDAFIVAQGGGVSIRDVIVTPEYQEGSSLCVNQTDGSIGVAIYSPSTLQMPFGATAMIAGVPYAIQYNCTSTFLFSLDIGGAMISAYEMCPSFDYVEIVKDMEFGPENMIYIGGVSTTSGPISYVTGVMDTVENAGTEDAIFAVVGLNGISYFPFAGEGIYYVNTYGSSNYELFTEIEVLNNEIYLMGGFVDLVDFDNGPNEENNIIYGNGDIVVYKMLFDAITFTESFSSLMTIGGAGNDYQAAWSSAYDYLTVDANGDFYMTVIGPNGIDLDPSPVTNNFPSGSYLAKYNGLTSVITGNVFRDDNGNGVQDWNELGVANVPIMIDNGSYSFFVTTNMDGIYSANVSVDFYQALPVYNTGYTNSIPAIYNSIDVNASNTTFGGNDFALQPAGVINDLIIQVYPLTPARPGFNAQYEIFIKNNGNVTETGNIDLMLDSNLTYISSSVVPTNIFPTNISWNIASLAPGADSSIIVDVTVSSTVGIGTLLVTSGYFYSPITTDIFPDDNGFELFQLTQGSYDPNDKQVFPSSVSQAFVDNQEYLNYLIRFQNTGTDTAFTVIVRDTLDVNLQVETLEILTTSHELTPTMYYDQVSGKQIMEFKFENILLPDSNINEVASHGYLSYRIKLDTLFTTGSVATNTADIYFDFNAPVITNTTITKINELNVSGIINDVVCFNQCNGEINLGVSGGLAPYYYAWSNASGISIANQNLCAGEYTVQIWDSIGNVGTYSYQINEPLEVGFTSSVVDASTSVSSDGEINVIPTGGTAPYLITYNGNSSSTNLQAGMYNVCVIDANGCGFCDSVEVSFTTDIETNLVLENIVVAPNPASNFINILYNGNNEIGVSILNNMGQLIFTKSINSNYQFDVSMLSQGVYFVKLESANDVIMKRMQVLK